MKISTYIAMAKTELIIVRVDPETKSRIEAAARLTGKSITTFILEAAEKAARKAEAMPTAAMQTKPKGRGACPTFFLAFCTGARQGGESGYFGAGHELMRHVASLGDDELGEAEWDARLDQLEELLTQEDDDGILQWFEQELPRCMKLVPARRRGQFLKGVYAMFEEDGELRR